MARNNKHYFGVRGTGKRYVRFPVPVTNAKKPASFLRTKKHVLQGVEGEACSCANAEAALEGLGGFGWSFTKSRAYKIDRVNKHGVPIHATCYVHNQDGFQEKYDRLGKTALMGSPDCEAEVVLNPPPKYIAQKGSRAYAPSAKDGSHEKLKRKQAKSELARFTRQGVSFTNA